MLYESMNNLTRAENVYDDILAEDPSNDSILKRKVLRSLSREQSGNRGSATQGCDLQDAWGLGGCSSDVV